VEGVPRLIDVKHLGVDRVIGSWLVEGLLIDPGPESCVDTLFAELGDEKPRGVLLTHIHFDHAGATGSLLERWPDVPVWVHERGARHLVDPTKLVASARQIWGDDFDRLWGEVVPVPEANLHVLEGGETVEGFDVEYVPGHAKHHVAYFHRDTGHAYVGDMAGVRIPPSDVTRAPTPPPDIDIEAWLESLDRIEARKPTAVVLTHFGRVEDVEHQLESVRSALRRQADMAKEMTEEEFTAELEARAEPETAGRLTQAAGPDALYAGLKHYWSKVAA
jgi:glyoxylase-like metal-dependent hydrolase (beta-lactamase superfamily II)